MIGVKEFDRLQCCLRDSHRHSYESQSAISSHATAAIHHRMRISIWALLHDASSRLLNTTERDCYHDARYLGAAEVGLHKRSTDVARQAGCKS